MKTSIVKLIAACIFVLLICFPLSYLTQYLADGLRLSTFAAMVFKVSPEAFGMMIITTIVALALLWYILVTYIIDIVKTLRQQPKATTVLSVDDPDIERKLAFIYNREQRVDHR